MPISKVMMRVRQNKLLSNMAKKEVQKTKQQVKQPKKQSKPKVPTRPEEIKPPEPAKPRGKARVKPLIPKAGLKRGRF